MTKKKGESVASIIASFLESLVGGMFSNMFSLAKDRVDDIARHTARIMLYTLLLILSAVFVIIGGVSLIERYLFVDRGWLYLVAAVALLFWALITKIQIEKEA